MAYGQESPSKLSFTVVSVSGEDPDYPALELLSHRAGSRGWQSSRNPRYPQELILKIEAPARLKQLQILSHEYKISSRVEVYFASPEAAWNSTASPWRRLGFLSLDPNEASGHQARELKSVELNIAATGIRLVFHEPHVNRYNTGRQVGIVALNLVGWRLPESASVHGMQSPAMTSKTPQGRQQPQHFEGDSAPQPEASHAMSQPNAACESPAQQTPRASAAGGRPDLQPERPQQPAVSDATLRGLDPESAAKVEELRERKSAAVAAEDFEEAKKLKQSIQRLMDLGAKLGRLEAEKADAISREDYDTAKAIKQQIARMRASGGDIPSAAEARRRSVASSAHQASDSANDSGETEHMSIGKGGRDGAEAAPQLPPMGSGLSRPGQFSVHDEQAVGPGSGNNSNMPSEYPPGYDPSQHTTSSSRSPASGNHNSNGSPAKLRAASAKAAGNAPQRDVPAEAVSSQPYDDKPAMGTGEYNLNDPGALAAQGTPSGKARPAGYVPLKRGQGAGGGRRAGKPVMAAGHAGKEEHPSSAGKQDVTPVDTADKPQGWNGSLPDPEEISPGDLSVAEPLVPCFGEFLVRCMCSQAWKLRSEALSTVTSQLQDGSLPLGSQGDRSRDVVRAFGPLLLRLVADKNALVSVAAMAAVKVLLAEHGESAGRDTAKLVGDVLPALLERSGDSNQRASKTAIETVVAVAAVPEASLASQTHVLVRPVKSQAQWKPVLGRLQLLVRLIPTLGVTANDSGSGFAARPLMAFVCAALGSTSPEVRNEAVAAVVAAASVAGIGAIHALLDKSINPKLLDQINVALESSRSRPPPTGGEAQRRQSKMSAGSASIRKENMPPSGTQPSVALPAKEKRGGVFPGSAQPTANSRPMNPDERPLPKPKPAARTAVADSQTNRQTASPKGKSKAGPPKPAKAAAGQNAGQAISQQLSTQQPAHSGEPTLQEEAARLVNIIQNGNELEAARAAASLGLLYQDARDFTSAEIMLQRAAKGLEANLGGNNIEVGELVVDLASLYLDQGKETEGLQLLQKALAIQAPLLGENHPDVVAIREVIECV